MRVVKESIGNTDILIQSMDDDLEFIGEELNVRSTQLTGIKDDVKDFYEDAKSIVTSMAGDISKKFNEIEKTLRPDEVEMEFSLGFSAKFGVWILNGTGESTLKVKMKWDLSKDEH